MKIKEFRDDVYREALEQGASFAELAYSSSDHFTVQVQAQEIDEYEAASTARISLRVLFNGKEGIAYTEVLEDAKGLVTKAVDNARVIEDKDEHPVQGPQVYREVTLPEDPLAHYSEADKIKLAFKLEEAVLKEDEVIRTHAAAVSTVKSYQSLNNSLGLSAERKSASSTVMLAPILKRGDEMQNAYAFRWDEKALDIDGIVEEAVTKAKRRFGGQPVPAGSYPVLISKEAARSLLAGFWSVFSAEMSQKKLSFLTGLEGEVIASKLITLVSDPYLKTNPLIYDGEGSPAKPLTLVEDGVFLTFLHNLKTAKKAGLTTTGHSSALGSGISPGNLYIKAGETKAEDLRQLLGTGLLIEGVSGLHAGLNSVSGEFSLMAEGQWLEEGEVVHAVDQITIAGNFKDLLTGISHVGDDLYFGGPGGIGSPSLILPEMKVGGR